MIALRLFMRASAPSLQPPAGRSRVSPEALAGCEKPCCSSDLEQGSREFTKPPQAPPHLTAKLVCQGDTYGRDPFWDGPRLLPVFVAQLLGQVMPDRSPALSRNAYRSHEPCIARLLDRKS